MIEQIRLAGPFIGESTLVVGPDGTSVLIDVGNDAHDGAVREALVHHAGETAVDWVVLTHLHGDHIGGFDALFDPGDEDAIPVRRGVVLRGGPVGSGAGNREVRRLEGVLTDPDFTAPVWRLCDGACSTPWPGDLEDPDDAGPVLIDLGGGAELGIGLANGVLATQAGLAHAAEEGLVLDPDSHAGENALSLGGWVQRGEFAYVFAGDLDGGGKGGPDVQGFVAARADAPWPGGAEVLHLDHHGIASSTNAAWIARFLPGGDRNAVVGANWGYLDAPSDEVLDALHPALGAGRVWAAGTGSLVGDHPALVDARQSVVVHVPDGGASYEILLRDEAALSEGASFSSVED